MSEFMCRDCGQTYESAREFCPECCGGPVVNSAPQSAPDGQAVLGCDSHEPVTIAAPLPDGGLDLEQEFLERDLGHWRKLRARGDRQGLTRTEWEVYKTVDNRLRLAPKDPLLAELAKGGER